MSSNIVGEGFENYVVGQITKRQEILGKPKKTSQNLIWENSRTGFVKLASSANINNLGDFGGGFTASSQLAERYVLFNGITDEISTRSPGIETLQRGGIDPRGFATNTGAYGLGGTQWGFNPMPGITTANIRSEAMGSLRTATVSVRANNRDQFELINTLYLRLGYLMLLEWGHNCYYKNNDTFVDDTTVSLVDPFIEAKYSYNEFLKQIQERRELTNGNYDALIGKVVNFNWTFNKDGSYDITIIIRSVGDVIESLKANVLSNSVTVDNPAVVTSISNLSQFLTRQLGSALQGVSLPTTTTGGGEGFNAVDPAFGKPTSNSIVVAFSKAHSIGARFAEIQYKFYETYSGKSPKTSNANGMQFLPVDGDIKEYIVQEYGNGLTSLYVRFGTFLETLDELVIPNIKDGGKIVSFGDTIDKGNRILAYSPGRQISSDPRICTFRKTLGEYTISPEATDPFHTVGNNSYIKLMNVYFNFVFILKLLEDLKDKDGKVPLVDLLNAMWKGYCKATGNYNNITVRIDEDSNQIIFVDETALPDREALLLNKNYAKFDVYGFETVSGSMVGGSFIRDLQLRTEITPQLATMITVGSTANGYVTGQDATTLSNLNKDTTPRISSELISPQTPSTEPADANPPTETRYPEAITSYENFVKTIGFNPAIPAPDNLPQWNEDAFTNFTSTQTQLLEYEQQFETNTARKTTNIYASSPNNGFLPFNLSLTMDGLSGMKIYQRYTINSTFLPKMYSNTVDFIVKSINHTIQNNTWLTNIESIAIPKFATPSKKVQKVTGPLSLSEVLPGLNSPVSHTDINQVGKLRNLIVAKAKGYVGVTEIGETTGFRPNTVNFENKIKSVGWYSGVGTHWCNWFANLAWKEAYNEYAQTNPLVKPTISDVLNNFTVVGVITPPLTADPIKTFGNMSNVKGTNYTIRFVNGKSIPKPGDMIIYTSGHVSICAEVNIRTRQYGRIDGNWGTGGNGKVVYTPIGGYGTSLDNFGEGVQILGFVSPPYADEDDNLTSPFTQKPSVIALTNQLKASGINLPLTTTPTQPSTGILPPPPPTTPPPFLQNP
jgi:hypothetical protein